mmetsp:Transcript_10709/g.25250  ORF Transcript_10709/g.25250 Transcript_10709/m.25250 type:complete len:363 (+) Transcript_10709:293-1381(+)
MGNKSSSPARIPAHPAGQTMKAVCFSSSAFGDADALSVQTIPKPFVSKGLEVLVKVHACALNPIDKLRVKGSLNLLRPEEYDMGVLGYDVSGVVEEVGANVNDFAVGDEVFVRLMGMKYGALAEYVVCEVEELAKKPKNISHSQAAAIPLVGLTALQALRRGGVKEGSKVFIHCGAGGIGSIGIQIAKKMLKASYVCTTASPGLGTDICTKAGADKIINYREEDFVEVLDGADFDMAFDTMNQSAQMGGLLKAGGKIVSISGNPTIEAIDEVGMSASLMVRAIMFMIRNRAAEKVASKAGGSWEYIFMSPSGKDLAEIAGFLESGEIKGFIDTEAPSLDEFRLAVDKLFSGRSKGKCVIKVV